MSIFYRVMALVILAITFQRVAGQSINKGTIMDAITREPVHGASVSCCNCNMVCITNAEGHFTLGCKDCRKISISSIGYQPRQVIFNDSESVISLNPAASLLNEIVVSANREKNRRSEAPVAISRVTAKMLQDAKAISADQVLNKVSGVYMVNLGNEQHQMSIRQPMTTKSLFLYLEDGIPVRTTGIFNHNALLEMNMTAVKAIEVIKGPSSALYGSEAIGGVVNFITQAPAALPVAKLSLQGHNLGYKRVDGMTSFSRGKWGFVLAGYYAGKKNSFTEFSDFNKATVTAKIDYRFNDKSKLSNSVTWMDYYSDMPGGIDSTMFADRSFKNPQTFTYRKVNAWRYRSTFTHDWTDRGKTSLSMIYRRNSIGQNPAYAIKEDYRFSNRAWRGNKELAHGEINNSSFKSYAFIGQHRQKLDWKKATVIAGMSIDLSPSTYRAEYISIQKDTVNQKFASYTAKDSSLTDYKNNISNYAGYLNFEFEPVRKMKVVASLRYDLFCYRFDNYLRPSAFSGSTDTTNRFHAVSPKIGFTYNISSKSGFYGNYSQGFVPPQVTEMYRGVKVPSLKASTFFNYEAGGWMEFIKDKFSMDFSIYALTGTNEIISVRMDDGSTENQNAGKTAHKGIEVGLNTFPAKDISIRVTGAYSKHRFIDFAEKGGNYSGNEMNAAPRWMHNAEVWYKPSYAKGLRIGIEWQKIGSYYMDPQNTVKYKGYNAFNTRAGYQFKGFEMWVSIINATNNYYAYIAGKTASGHSYTPAEPRHFNLGISYDFVNLFK